jgi:proteasome lid subunit RPN8/RPN11
VRIFDKTKAVIRAHAKEAAPNEACGLIVREGTHKQRVIRCENRSSFPKKSFRIAPEEFERAEDIGGEVLACYHSHVNEPPTPSMADKTVSEATRLPFVIIGWPTDSWDFYAPNGWRAQLIGRPFVHGILDCYTLCQDYFREKLGLELPEFYRDDLWWETGQDLYMQNFENAGFRRVDDLKVHDVILMQIPPSPVVCHSAVYLGDGHILQHLTGRLSGVTTYATTVGYYARATRAIVRHKSLLK